MIVWPCPLAAPMTLTLEFQGQESELAYYLRNGTAIINMERKGCESSIHDHDMTSVTMVGWVDVPNSDRGDFRRRRAVNISSFSLGIPYGVIEFVNIGLGDGGTKPLPQPMLTNHQWGLVAFTWGQFHRKYWRYLSLIWVSKFLI